MLSFNELEKGVDIIIDNQPYRILEASHLFKGRGHSVLQARLRNLISCNIISKTIHPSENFEEAEIKKIEAKFLYSYSVREKFSNGASRRKFIFCKKDNPRDRFELLQEQIDRAVYFLKPGQEVQGLMFQDKIINIILPIKVKLKVIEVSPGIKGDRAQGGTKVIILETGAKINAPLFIKEGDIVEINTENGEYVRRIESTPLKEGS